MSVYPTMAPFLASIAPAGSVYARVGDGLNDDDLYIVNVRTKEIVSRYGCKSVPAAQARMQGLTVKPGHALLTGMQARSFGVVA